MIRVVLILSFVLLVVVFIFIQPINRFRFLGSNDFPVVYDSVVGCWKQKNGNVNICLDRSGDFNLITSSGDRISGKWWYKSELIKYDFRGRYRNWIFLFKDDQESPQFFIMSEFDSLSMYKLNYLNSIPEGKFYKVKP